VRDPFHGKLWGLGLSSREAAWLIAWAVFYAVIVAVLVLG
jgi:hypothetical protein